MTMHQFLQKYGTRTVSLLLKTAAESMTREDVAGELVAIADDLEQALLSYEAEETVEEDWDAMPGRQG